MEKPKSDLYFSHDADARNDDKCVALRQKYGDAGYGRYWMLVEMMRSEVEAGYKLPLTNRFKWIAIAQQMQCKFDEVVDFVNACITEFELFSADPLFFWSESLLRRMLRMEEIRLKRTQSANKRWANPNAKQTHANAMQDYANNKEEIVKDLNTPLSPLSKKSRKRKPKTLIASDWQPSPDTIAWCNEKRLPEPEFQVDLFITYWHGKEESRSDWDASFRNWMISPYRKDRPHGQDGRSGRQGGYESAAQRNASTAAKAYADIEEAFPPGGDNPASNSGVLPLNWPAESGEGGSSDAG